MAIGHCFSLPSLRGGHDENIEEENNGYVVFTWKIRASAGREIDGEGVGGTDH